MNEKEKKIFDMQSESTKRCLARPRDLDTEWLNRGVPKSAQCLKKDGSVDLNIRSISAEEFHFFDEDRRKQGARFEDARTCYLKANAHKIIPKVHKDFETPHVMPTERTRERAIERFLKVGMPQAIKEAFAEIMKGVKKTIPAIHELLNR